MNEKADSTTQERKDFPEFKSTTEIARTASARHFKIVELSEYCRAVETNLKDLDQKIEILMAGKKESEKILSDYSRRNKINQCNSDSLLQAKNQLYKYKCELKSEYVILQRAIKEKKLKYDKIVSSYKDEWYKNLALYNANPTVVDLDKIEKENKDLTEKISKLQQHLPEMRLQYSTMETELEMKFRLKTIEFATQVLNYAVHVENALKNRKVKEDKKKENVADSEVKISIFGTKQPNLNDKLEEELMSQVDILEFDNLMVPVENLEAQNEDEFSLILPVESKEMLRPPPNGPADTAKEDKILKTRILRENPIRIPDTGDDSSQQNESQYFGAVQQQKQTSAGRGTKKAEKQQREDNGDHQKQKKCQKNDATGQPGATFVQEVKDREGASSFDGPKDESQKMDAEEVSSNGSFDNQFGYDKSGEIKLTSEGEDSYHYQYGTAPSTSKDVSMQLSEDKLNDSSRSPLQSKSEEDKDGFKSFKGFFTIGDEPNSPTPSIFKLF